MLENFFVWRERFEALFMQLYNLKIPSNIVSLMSVHPTIPKEGQDTDQGMVEALLRTRPVEIKKVDGGRLDIELLQKRAEIILANMDTIVERPSIESSDAPHPKTEEEANGRLIEAIKYYYQ